MSSEDKKVQELHENEVLCGEPWSFELVRKQSRGLELKVICGGVGIFEVCVELTPQEVDRWEKEGASFLRGLVKEIQSDPSKYRHRSPGK